MLIMLKRNDIKEPISYQITDSDGSVVNLTGASVNFVMGKKNKIITNSPAIITAATDGMVQYTFTNVDTLFSGKFLGEFVVTFPTGKEQTFPTNGYIDVSIIENIDINETNLVLDTIAERQGDFTSKLNSVLLQAGNINMSGMNEYTWTATDNQLTYVMPANAKFDPSSKWFEVYVGGIPVTPNLINTSVANKFTLLIDPVSIKNGMTVLARWTEPIVPVTSGHHSVHELNGQDEIDVTKLRGYTENVATQFTSVNTQLADKANKDFMAIDVCNPPSSTGLSAVKADGSDILGDTNRLQTILNYAINNKKDVYVPKDLILQPILQPDGSLVCITLDDGSTSGNNRKPIKIYCKKGVTLSTNNTTQTHTIIRWKLGDSILDGFCFVGTRAYTTGIQLSRINLTNKTEFDGTTRNKFTNLRFYTCNTGISMEGSAYYNTFDNITFFSSNLALWLKVSYALANGLNTNDSGVNRNIFYSLSAYACTDGIKLDFGDTNKFYGCSFEGVSGTAVQVNDQTATYSGVQQTIYNTFYGTTNEANNMNLILNSQWGNSFIDFEGSLSKVQFNYKPLVYIPSGDSGSNHLVLQNMFMLNDRNDMGYVKNRNSLKAPLYVENISDNIGLGTDNNAKGYDWRSFSFLNTDCTNVATLTFNSNNNKAIYKSIGKVVYYIVKLSFVPTTTTSTIKVPLPPGISLDNSTYTFGNNGALGSPITVQIGSNYYVTATKYDTVANTIEIKLPTGVTNWDATANVVLIDIHYVRNIAFVESN